MAIGNLVQRPDDAPLYVSRSTARTYPGTPGGGTGGGADEVWIGPTAPTDPGIELWVDTDAVPTSTGHSFMYDQGVPDDIWVIDHNLGFHPNVTVIDSAGDEVEGAISYPSVNAMTITFSAAFVGRAYLS